MNLLFAVLGALIVLSLSLLNWRWSVKTALLIVVLEGALRRWVLPQASEAIYFLKDIVLLGAYIGYFRRHSPVGRLSQRPFIPVLLFVFLVVLVIQIFNVSLNSVLVGLLGAKGYLFYLPLCFMAPDLFRSTDELCRYLGWYLLLSVPECVLGIMQFASPADSVINTYASSLVDSGGDVAVFGEEGNVRVTGTFPYIVGFSVYLTLSLGLLIALIAHQRSWRWRILASAEMLLIVVNLFMTGARSAVLSAVIMAVAFLVFSLFERSWRSRRLVVLLVVAAVGSLVFSVRVFPSAVAAFSDRAANSDNVNERIAASLTEPLELIGKGEILGYGAGACQMAGYALRQQLHLGTPLHYPPPAETEPVRVLLEMGVFGFAVWYGLRLVLVVILWNTSRQVRAPVLRHLALAACLIHALFFTGQLVTNPTFGVYYWFLAGFIFLLPRLDQAAAARRVRPPHSRSQQPIATNPLVPRPAPASLPA